MATQSRVAKLGFLLFGVAVVAYLGTKGPREQHVNVVLGDRAPDVTGLSLRYIDDTGELARDARYTYSPGAAPRVIAHEPRVPDGAYRLEVDIDTRERRVSVERQVKLGGGSTQVDVSDSLRTGKSP